MITSDKEVLKRYDGASIVNGPDRTSLMFAVFEGSEVFFRLANQHDETPVRIWSIRNHDSGRRNWTISGDIMTDPAKPISFEARYWMRNGKRFGNFKIS